MKDETGYEWESEGARRLHSLLGRVGDWLDSRNAPQTLPEHACPYCRSLHSLQRCPSCGAPRTEDKPKETELYRAWSEYGDSFARWRGAQ